MPDQHSTFIRFSLVRAFVLFFLPLSLVLGLFSIWHLSHETDIRNQMIRDGESRQIALCTEVFLRGIDQVETDLLFLAALSSRRLSLDIPTRQIMDSLAQDYMQFARYKGRYDQIRLLGEAGMELVRVNGSGESYGRVPDNLLQDKGDRYYYKDSLGLARGRIYTSPLDLNVERGQVEIPYKPMLRFLTPVFIAAGQRVGFVALNYLAGQSLDDLRAVHRDAFGRLMLLNRDGYWLMGPDPDKEWGFMFKDGRDASFANEFPEAWKRMKNQKSGQFFVGEALYTFAAISPFRELSMDSPGAGPVMSAESSERSWIVVSQVTGPKHRALVGEHLKRLLPVYSALFGIMLIGAFVLARSWDIRQRIQGGMARTNEHLGQTVSRLERRHREARAMNRMSDFLQACRSQSEIHEVVATHMAELFPKSSGMLYVMDTGRGFLERVSSWGDDSDDSEEFELSDCWALRRGRPYIIKNLRTEIPCPHFKVRPEAGSLCAPLVAQGQVTGLLALRFAPGFLDLPEQRLAQRVENVERLGQNLGDHVALAMANLGLRESLREQSIRDALTGLYNRRHMEESLQREFSRLNRQGGELSVIMFDVDHFKRFNDDYGHEAGDEVLRVLGGLLLSQSRAEDIACRYGGEEFLLIMPGAGIETASKRAEDLRARVEARQVVYGDKRLKVTISLGVSTCPVHGADAQTLVESADQALYRAKDQGRNRVELAQDCEPDPDGS